LAAAVVLNVIIKTPPITPKHSRKEKPVSSPWKDVLLLRFLGILLVVGILFFQIFGTWTLYLRQVCGFPENRIGLLMTINALMVAFFEMQLIHRIEKKEPLPLMALGTLFMAAGYALLPLMKNYGFIALTVILWTIGEMLIFPLAGAFIESRSSSGNSGTYMGLFTLTFSLSMMISPVLGTWVYNHFGPKTLWLAAGVGGLLAGIGFLNLRRFSEKKISVAEAAYGEAG
jgi:predicted MFS family arabinose efflux permease